MANSRRGFLKLACASGICSCAGTGFLRAEVSPGDAGQEEDPMPRKWILALLPVLVSETDQVTAGRVLKGAAEAHYEHLKMAEKTSPFRGKLEDFLAYLRAEWGWKIEYVAGSDTIMIDEAKSTCVCPLVRQGVEGDLSILCNCSEGFAERLFSGVVGSPVRAEVVQSVLRGASSCQYRITLTRPA